MGWLVHVLRMPQAHIPRVELRWTPTGKRSKGRLNTTWRRSIIAKLSDMGDQGKAQNRKSWRNDIVALCPTRDELDKQESRDCLNGVHYMDDTTAN